MAVLKKELPAWKGRILAMISENPTWSEVEVAWKLIEEMGIAAAALLMPVFEREKGRKGRLSLQTNPTFYRNADAIVEQAKRFAKLAPNIQVKIPASSRGHPGDRRSYLSRNKCKRHGMFYSAAGYRGGRSGRARTTTTR